MAESMTGLKRTCRCAELTTENISQTVTVMGWVQKSRNKGGIVFVDLRDYPAYFRRKQCWKRRV